ALSYLRLGEKEKACQLYEATNKANKKNTYYIDGAKKNLQELVDKKICEEDAKYILKEIF
ncbi:MAG: FAD-dependent thymidylate synthase, partial [Bacteroidales bacterium]|nr:FAD-dependent thymidylate synthase [Bacteroidales bacterium]